MKKICSTRKCGKPVIALGVCRSCYDKHIYRTSKNSHQDGNGHQDGRPCLGCGTALLYRSDDATLCGACLRRAYLNA